MRAVYNTSMLLLLAAIVLIGCGPSRQSDSMSGKVKIGVMLADYGLGDQSFNDTAFLGLVKARDELDILFDYRDLVSSASYRDGLIELIEEEKCTLVIGLGNNMIQDFTDVAYLYPSRQFLFIDQKIEAPNVTSITFKEDEGSFLAGLIAGLKTETNIVGFIGGMNIPVINRFRDGFAAGVKTVNPDATVIVEYAGDFGNPAVGKEIAGRFIQERNADIIYPAAGFTGLGAIEEAATKHVYAIGVDSDQFYLAENTVITSMIKNIDVAVYKAVKQFVEEGALSNGHMELGIADNGVGIAPVRVVPFSAEQSDLIQLYNDRLLNGAIAIRSQSTRGGTNQREG